MGMQHVNNRILGIWLNNAIFRLSERQEAPICNKGWEHKPESSAHKSEQVFARNSGIRQSISISDPNPNVMSSLVQAVYVHWLPGRKWALIYHTAAIREASVIEI